MGSKRGRPRKAGARTKSGRLITAHDRGNDRVVALDAQYACFQGGKAMPWARESAIGRAWAVGLLDGYKADAAAIRDTGLRFGALHDSYGYRIGSGVSNYEAEDRRGSTGIVDPILKRGIAVPRDPAGQVFKRLSEEIGGVSWGHLDAVHALCCDYFCRPWENPPWLDRLINRAQADKGKPVTGWLPKNDGSDERMMKMAVEGLLVIVAGNRRKVA